MKKTFILTLLMFFNYFNCADIKDEKTETANQSVYTFINQTGHCITIGITLTSFESKEIKLKNNIVKICSFEKTINQVRLNLDENSYLIWNLPSNVKKIFFYYYSYNNTYKLTVELNEKLPDESMFDIQPILYYYSSSSELYYLKNVTVGFCRPNFYCLINATSSTLNLEIMLKTCVIYLDVHPGDKKMIPYYNEDYEIQSILIKQTNQEFDKNEFVSKKFQNHICIYQ